MRRVLWVVAAWIALGPGACTGRPDPIAFVDRYVQLHRAADIDGLLALHTSDSEFLIPGQEPIRGRAALRDLFEWDAVLGSQLTVGAIHAEGETIFIDRITERSKWFEGIGLESVRYREGTRFVLRGGRIAGTYPAAFDEATERRVIEGFRPLVQWLRENREGVLEQLLPGGKFHYDAAHARLWLKVLAEWKASRQEPSNDSGSSSRGK